MTLSSGVVWLLLVGLLAVAVAWLLLTLRLSRRGAALADFLEAAARGEATAQPRARREPFSRALEIAQQMGQELNEARGERQHAELRMGALMKALDVGVVVLEPDFRLGFANRRALELLGCPSSDELAPVWDAEIKPMLATVLACVDGAGVGRRVEHELPARAGQPRLTLEFYELGEGSCEGYLGLAKNAESVEALEGELGLAMQMRGLTRFYAAFAHDLKAPLNAMVMNLELLKLSGQADTGMEEATRAKQAKYVGVLNEEIRRLDRQLRTLLSQTAPPSDERRRLDLRSVVEDLGALLGAQARRQRVALTTTLPEAAVTIVGISDRLKQALLNILINALEAMPEGGELAIALEARDTRARLTVHDSGPGIPPELLRSIYEMHFTTKSGGSGVGLYVARTVMRAHGGTIDVDTGPERGTTFAIEIPLAPAP
ncbi:MAG: sensor histidine kinase [Candidatus Binatia bacterium]